MEFNGLMVEEGDGEPESESITVTLCLCLWLDSHWQPWLSRVNQAVFVFQCHPIGEADTDHAAVASPS